MAANPLLAPSLVMGYDASGLGNATTLSLSAAATWLAYGFVTPQAKTLSTVRAYLSAKTGTPAASELTCDLYSDSGSGTPGTSLESRPASSVPAAGNWMDWAGFTTALTAGTQYWLVFKNTNATPASNSPTYQYVGNMIPVGAASNYSTLAGYGWVKVHTVNSGTAWATTPTPSVGGFRVGYSDSTYDGLPVQTFTRPGLGSTANRAFGKQEVGVKFSVPAGATYNVRGVWFPLAKFGTPGNVQFRLYQGVTLLATTYAIPAGNVSTTNDGYTALFASAQSLTSANGPYRVTINDVTAADTNASGYNGATQTWDSDSNSLTLKPMNGTLQKTITADNTATPVAFTDTSTDVMSFALLLDTAGEFTASGGGIKQVSFGGGFDS